MPRLVVRKDCSSVVDNFVAVTNDYKLRSARREEGLGECELQVFVMKGRKQIEDVKRVGWSR